MAQRHFNSHTGLEDRVFAFWTGSNPMSENRRACLETFANTQCEVILVDRDGLSSWVLEDHPLHPAYEYLSPVHRSDYLRAYFMHYHGGGYSDIKRTTQSWLPTMEQLRSSDTLGAGYAELSSGVAKIARSHIDGQYYLIGKKSSYWQNYILYKKMKIFHDQLIGNVAFVFKPRTAFTEKWLEAVEKRLDVLLPQLERHPARHPRERPLVDYGDGPSQYPVPWTFLLGDIVAPLSYAYRRQMLRSLPAPDFEGYE